LPAAKLRIIDVHTQLCWAWPGAGIVKMCPYTAIKKRNVITFLAGRTVALNCGWFAYYKQPSTNKKPL